MTLEKFEELVYKTISKLPGEFLSKMENVGVVVEAWPTWEHYQKAGANPQGLLFGLYQGIPKTKRGDYYFGVLPDKITIFAGPIMLVSKNLKELKAKITETVKHEIGHHFGLSDQQIYNAQRTEVKNNE